MRHDSGVARALRQLNCLQRLGQRSNLVQLDQDRIADPIADALREDLHVGHKDIVPDQLHTFPKTLGQHAPALPVKLTQTILDRQNRKAVHEARVVPDHLLGRPLRLPFSFEAIPALVVELAGCRVEG